MSEKTLKLTLKRKWFDMIASGEKKEEYRAPSPWIMSRLLGKSYNRVQFRNGYSKESPMIECEYLGWGWSLGRKEWGAPGEILLATIKLGAVITPPISHPAKMSSNPLCHNAPHSH